jgi:hypothetical protein
MIVGGTIQEQVLDAAQMVEYLAELAGKLGIIVRWEEPIGEGGICELRGKRYLFVDRSTDAYTQLEVMANALCDEPLEDVFILPEVRERLDHARAEKRRREERQSR